MAGNIHESTGSHKQVHMCVRICVFMCASMRAFVLRLVCHSDEGKWLCQSEEGCLLAKMRQQQQQQQILAIEGK